MSSGISALMEHAHESQSVLPFHIAMYNGGMLTTGAVAPWWWMYDVTASVARAESAVTHRRVKDPEQREAFVEQAVEPLCSILTANRSKPPKDLQEVTLADASVFPAVQTQGTQSGGLRLPVVRIPFTAISAWWIVEGAAIRGSGGGSSWGFVFPIS